mmetsp:Transcript_49777/g.144440  ORF Transcript_49777/g.144440 Transcript_49777/m.144440 type:complete len:248 (+) Transcript_49777:1918-2661(+)
MAAYWDIVVGVDASYYIPTLLRLDVLAAQLHARGGVVGDRLHTGHQEEEHQQHHDGNRCPFQEAVRRMAQEVAHGGSGSASLLGWPQLEARHQLLQDEDHHGHSSHVQEPVQHLRKRRELDVDEPPCVTRRRWRAEGRAHRRAVERGDAQDHRHDEDHQEGHGVHRECQGHGDEQYGEVHGARQDTRAFRLVARVLHAVAHKVARVVLHARDRLGHDVHIPLAHLARLGRFRRDAVGGEGRGDVSTP